MKAVVFESLDKHDSAYHYYSKSLDIDPDIFDAYKKRAIYRSELKDWKGSYSDLKQMLRLQPESPAALRLSGLIKANLKDYFGAIIDITKFIKIDTTDFDMWRARAICRENIKDNAGAIKDYQTALDIRPKSEEILHSIKFNYLVIGDSTSAIKVALKIKSIWNYDLRVNVDLAEMYFYIKKTDSSWFYLQPVLDESKNPYSDRQLNSDALFIKGKLLLDQGKVKDGMNALNKSISIDSSDEKRYFRAITLLRRGNEEDALEDLRVLKKNNFKKADGLFVKYNIK